MIGQILLFAALILLAVIAGCACVGIIIVGFNWDIKLKDKWHRWNVKRHNQGKGHWRD